MCFRLARFLHGAEPRRVQPPPAAAVLVACGAFLALGHVLARPLRALALRALALVLVVAVLGFQRCAHRAFNLSGKPREILRQLVTGGIVRTRRSSLGQVTRRRGCAQGTWRRSSVGAVQNGEHTDHNDRGDSRDRQTRCHGFTLLRAHSDVEFDDR